jgi:hypothetical protein
VESGKAYRSVGLELSGSRNQRTCFAVLDFYPKSHRLILSELKSELGPRAHKTGDQVLLETLAELAGERFEITGISSTVPISLPPFFQTKLVYDEQTDWVTANLERAENPKPFIPYLQRPVEFWLRYFAKERFQIGDALGSNLAPLTARLKFLEPSLQSRLSESFIRGTLIRILPSLNLKKELTDDYSDLEKGLQIREQIIKRLSDSLPQLFIYDWDLEKLILELHSFHAFLAALNQHLDFLGLCEERPKNYPKSATWVALPERNLRWEDALKIP